jgi:hypothetical protein
MDRAAALRHAETLLRQGKLDEAIADCVRLADQRRHDWHIGNLLGDLYVRAGRIASSTAASEGHAVLDDLAGVLESANEQARARAICLELQAEAGDYRDVADRVVRLAKGRARG